MIGPKITRKPKLTVFHVATSHWIDESVVPGTASAVAQQEELKKTTEYRCCLSPLRP